MNNKVFVGIGVMAVAIAGALVYVKSPLKQTQPPFNPPVAVTEHEPERHPIIRDLPAPGAIPKPKVVTVKPERKIVTPPNELKNSDSLVTLAVTDLSADVVQWLTPKEQIRKWVLLVDNMATGKVLVKNRPLQYPVAPMAVTTNTGTTLLGDNQKRTEILINTLVKCDPSLLLRYYQSWLPLLEKAYDELGQEGDFDSRFQQALDNAIAVDANAALNAKLKRPSVFYQYTNPELENASDLEKLVWRLGPVNAEKLQAYLRTFRAQL